MYCYKCGAQIPDESVFCLKCGTKMPDIQEVDNDNTDSKSTEKSGKKSSNSKPTKKSSNQGRTSSNSEKKTSSNTTKKTETRLEKKESIEEKNSKYLEKLLTKNNWSIVNNEKGNLATYSFDGRNIIFDDYNQPIISIYKEFAIQAEKRQKAFESMYEAKVKSTMDMLEIAFPYLQKDVDIGITFAIRMLKENGVEDMDKSSFTDFLETRYYAEEDEYYYGDAITLNLDDVEKRIDFLSRQADANQAYRDEGKYNRSGGGWVGGGFGIKGAIKGALVAGALNMAGDAINSLSRQVATYSSDKLNRERMIELYRKKYESFYEAYEEFYLDDLFTKVIMILADKGIVKWQPYTVKDNETPIEAIQGNPYYLYNYYRLYNSLSNPRDKVTLKEMASFFGLEYFYIRYVIEIDNEKIDEIRKSDCSDDEKIMKIKEIEDGNSCSKAAEAAADLLNEISDKRKKEIKDTIKSVKDNKDWYKAGVLNDALNKLKSLGLKEEQDGYDSCESLSRLIECVGKSLENNIFLAQISPAISLSGDKGIHFFSLGDLENIDSSTLSSKYGILGYSKNGFEFPIMSIYDSSCFFCITTSAFYIKDSEKSDRFLLSGIKEVQYMVNGVINEEYFFYLDLKNSHRYFSTHGYDAYHSFKKAVIELNKRAKGTAEASGENDELLTLLNTDRINTNDYDGKKAILELDNINQFLIKKGFIVNGEFTEKAESIPGFTKEMIVKSYNLVTEKLTSVALDKDKERFSSIEEASRHYEQYKLFEGHVSGHYAVRGNEYEYAQKIIDFSEYAPALIELAKVYKQINAEGFDKDRESLYTKLRVINEKIKTPTGRFAYKYLSSCDKYGFLKKEMDAYNILKDYVDCIQEHPLDVISRGRTSPFAFAVTDKAVYYWENGSLSRINIENIRKFSYKNGIVNCKYVFELNNPAKKVIIEDYKNEYYYSIYGKSFDVSAPMEPGYETIKKELQILINEQDGVENESQIEEKSEQKSEESISITNQDDIRVKCPACGKMIKTGVSFCNYCGTRQ